jgi:hypothetical protein
MPDGPNNTKKTTSNCRDLIGVVTSNLAAIPWHHFVPAPLPLFSLADTPLFFSDKHRKFRFFYENQNCLIFHDRPDVLS